MAEWLVGKILDTIINTCSQYFQDRIGSQTSMEMELERLRENSRKIQAIVSASNQAEIRDCNEALDEWMWRLRYAIEEAHDLLEEFEILERKGQLTRSRNMDKSETNKRFPSVQLVLESARKYFKFYKDGVLKTDHNLKRLEEVVKKLDEVSAEVSVFSSILDYTKQEQQAKEQHLYDDRERGSSPGPVFLGRGMEKDYVMKWLTKPANEDLTETGLFKNISLLSIVGHGGMGKTALLQHVYEDVEESFDRKIWVYVSNNFKEEEVIMDMLKYLNKRSPRLTKLPHLQKELKSVMQSRKFLLVLDDIWEGNTTKWGNVLSPLAKGSLGGKILVTTRMDSTASMIADVIRKKNEMLRLEGLGEDECLQLLKTHAFGFKENIGAHKELDFFAKEIAKKLSGSPLAAKVIGNVLKSELTPKHWEGVLKKSIGSIISLPGQITNTIMLILRLSYSILSEPLKKCFAFCGIFPKGHLFDKDDLVRIWIALDFIQPPSNPGETIEDIGRWYFDFLVKRSFFDKKHSTFYTMHDLLHELALHVSTQKCYRFVENNQDLKSFPETIRHLFVETTDLDVLRNIAKLKHLRSLFLTCPRDDQNFIDLLDEVFEALRSVRVLFICFPQLKMLPESIEKLIHLRYLNFYRTDVTLLPKSLCNLYYLQFFIFESEPNWAFTDVFIPENLNNLSNLRYLKLPQKVFHKIPGIGNLQSLQELDRFFVRNENGYRIKELEYMNKLRRLEIKRLENVVDAEEACSSKLCDKENLTYLSLDWTGSDLGFRRRAFRRAKLLSPKATKEKPDSDLAVKVLENLKPHKNLKELLIHAYMGTMSATWMNEVNLISNLEYIKLDECLNWKTLPSFGRLPHLKYLYLLNMPKVELLDEFPENAKVCVFPSLEVLHIENLQALEVWFDVEAAKDNGLFPCLNTLYLKECPKLQELPYLPLKLERLEMDNIRWKSLNFLKDTNNYCSIIIRNCKNLMNFSRETTKSYGLRVNAEVEYDPSVLLMEPLRCMKSINKLKICYCPVILFPCGVEQWFQNVSSSLCELYFVGLQNLEFLPYFLGMLSSLKILSVRYVPKLQWLSDIPLSLEQLELGELESLKLMPEIPASLEQLRLHNLKSLQCLPCSLSNSSLKILYINTVPQLKQLPANIPASLEILELQNLESLQSLPCSLSSSSLKILHINTVPQLKQLPPNIPASLEQLELQNLESLQSLPCSLSSSSFKILHINTVPQLEQLPPNIPASLKQLELQNLESLQSLPFSLSSSSLKILHINKVPQLEQLPPNIPTSLERLQLQNLESLQCLPPLLNVSSLEYLCLASIPLLESLPDLPPSLFELSLEKLGQLDCLPSCLPTLYSLDRLCIGNVSKLRKLPELPLSLESLSISGCHPVLMKRYKKASGSDWHKIAHIPDVNICS